MEKRLIYRKDIIRGAKQRWLQQYKKHDDEYTFYDDKTVGSMRAKLNSIDAQAASLNDIIACFDRGSGWTDNECMSCGQNAEVLVRIDVVLDDDDHVDLCKNCIATACEEIEGAAADQNALPTAEDVRGILNDQA